MKDDHQFRFSKTDLEYTNPYHNHLPSFSSALLHIGSCFDQFFILLKLFYEGIITGPADFYDEKKLRINFRTDVKLYGKVLRRISSNDPVYCGKGMSILELNRFRNYFAHSVRLLWWHRDDNTKVFYFLRKLYDRIMNKRSDGAQEVFDMLKDTKAYEEGILAADTRELISAKEIIDCYHGKMVDIFNLTFGYILNKI